jgi:putative copper export protein
MNGLVACSLAVWPLVACEVMIFGTTAFALIAVPGNDAGTEPVRRALLPLWRGLATTTILLSPMAVLVGTACMADTSVRASIPLVSEVLRLTHWGQVWVWRLPVTIALLIAAWTPGSSARKSAALCALAALLLLLRSITSHAIDVGAVAMATYFVHELAAGLWLGALAGLWVTFALMGGGDWLGPTVRRVSQLAGWCAAALPLSGLYMAYNAFGLSLDRLLYSAYGRTLLAKVMLFAAVVSIGGYNRYRLIPAKNPSGRGALLRNVGIESVLLLGVLGIAALLANTPPPLH